MKIYDVQIKMPHSGELSRSQCLTLLQKAVKNNYSGAGKFDKSKTKDECQKYYNTLLIEDVNYEYTTTLQ